MLKIKRIDAFLALHIASLILLLIEIASKAQKKIGAHLRFNNSRATRSLFTPQLEIIERIAA